MPRHSAKCQSAKWQVAKKSSALLVHWLVLGHDSSEYHDIQDNDTKHNKK
jgi:hypothetical protein